MATVIGVCATLVGIIIGAFLTRWIDFTYQRRKEIRDAVEAALIIREELRDTKVGLNVLFELERGSGDLRFDGIEVWDSYRGQLLPSGISHGDWAELNALFRHLTELKAARLDGPREFDKKTLDLLRNARNDCGKAIEVLNGFAVEGDIPLLTPKRIFN